MFGALREGHAYSAPCRTTADGPFDNRIIWYFVPDDAPVYEGVNAFEPRVDNIYDLAHGTLEKCALSPCPRKHYDGRDLWFRDATGVIGTEDDFAGRSRVGDCLCREGPPHEPCVSGPHAFNMVLLGHESTKALDGEARFGFRLGGIVTRMLDMEAFGGLALGAPLTFIPPPPLELDAGLALGDRLTGLSVDGPTLSAGLALGAVMTFIPPPPLELDAGLALGDTLDVATAAAAELDAGLALGDTLDVATAAAAELDAGLALGDVLDVATAAAAELDAGQACGAVMTPKETELDAGLACGAVFTPIPPTVSITELDAGLALGMVASVPDEGTEGGADCDSAVEMELGTEYTVDVLSSTEQWFWFDEPAITFVHCKRLSSSGGSGQIDVYQGGSCGSKSSIGSLTSDGQCVQTSSMGATKIFVKVKHNSGGTFHCVFVGDTGGCP